MGARVPGYATLFTPSTFDIQKPPSTIVGESSSTWMPPPSLAPLPDSVALDTFTTTESQLSRHCAMTMTPPPYDAADPGAGAQATKTSTRRRQGTTDATQVKPVVPLYPGTHPLLHAITTPKERQDARITRERVVIFSNEVGNGDQGVLQGCVGNKYLPPSTISS